MNPTTVEFWLRSFVDHAEKAAWKAGEEPQVARLFIKFVVKRTINSECLEALSHLVERFQTLKRAAPQMTPPAVGALLILATQDLDATTSMDFGDMPLAARNEFVDSPLFKQFLKARLQKKLVIVKGDVDAKPDDRHKTVRTIMSSVSMLDKDTNYCNRMTADA